MAAPTPIGVDLDLPVSQAGWTVREVLDRLECVRGRCSRVSLLSGGLTNRNYRVTTDDSDLVVRVSPPGDSPLPIDRAAEHRNSLIAAEAGVGARVVEFLPWSR